jgi:hypothetical protein
MYEMIE